MIFFEYSNLLILLVKVNFNNYQLYLINIMLPNISVPYIQLFSHHLIQFSSEIHLKANFILLLIQVAFKNFKFYKKVL